jgi:hypothetical protein
MNFSEFEAGSNILTVSVLYVPRLSRNGTNADFKGKVIEKQKDMLTGEFKYRFKGPTLSNGIAETVLKFGFHGKAVIITVYKARQEIL